MKKINSGVVLYRESDVASHLYVLNQGRVNLCCLNPRGEAALLHSLQPGEIFGLLALHDTAARYLVSARSVGNASVLCWTRSEIRAAARRCPQQIENCFNLVVQYLSETLSMHAAMRKTAQEKLATTLLSRARQKGVPATNGMRIDTTNEELAQLSGVTLSTANRLLSKWAQQGVLSTVRSSVVLHSPDGLLAVPLTSSYKRSTRKVRAPN